MPNILTINGGSSSIKFALYRTQPALERILSGSMEHLASPMTELEVTDPDKFRSKKYPIAAGNRKAAALSLVSWLKDQKESAEIQAIGHRFVSGGPRYSASEVISAPMLEELQRLSAFDPDHLPAELELVNTLREHFSDVLQVACFDTSFHHGMPRLGQLIAIPRRFEAKGIRRYGFHGLSYTFLLEELERLEGLAESRGRVILAHLGSGASLTAVREGKSIDTSMGFTPVSGVPMGTRSGDLDPGLVSYLARTENMDPEQFQQMINHESGLLGISQTNSDMRELLKNENSDIRSMEAVAFFCYQVKKTIGSFSTVLGGLDTLVFSGGIGENAPLVRERICENLEFLGIELDRARNVSGPGIISKEGSRVKVRVIRTDEERVIAEAILPMLNKFH